MKRAAKRKAKRAFAIGDRVLIGPLKFGVTGSILNYTDDPAYFWIKLDTPLIFKHGSPIGAVVRHVSVIEAMSAVDRIAELDGPDA